MYTIILVAQHLQYIIVHSVSSRVRTFCVMESLCCVVCPQLPGRGTAPAVGALWWPHAARARRTRAPDVTVAAQQRRYALSQSTNVGDVIVFGVAGGCLQ